MFVATVVNPIGIEKKNISGTQQCDLIEIGSVYLCLPEVHGVVFLIIRMICWDLQTERKKLRHTAFVDVHELAILCREHQGWRMPEIRKAKMTARADFAVYHGCVFACVSLLNDS